MRRTDSVETMGWRAVQSLGFCAAKPDATPQAGVQSHARWSK
ncbi:MAG: hypothetical protein U1D29_12350 [Burkholderiales bacterium]|nr:hypothetical protein [Burkholderiales bacterium]